VRHQMPTDDGVTAHDGEEYARPLWTKCLLIALADLEFRQAVCKKLLQGMPFDEDVRRKIKEAENHEL
jgi:hypothetical protein